MKPLSVRVCKVTHRSLSPDRSKARLLRTGSLGYLGATDHDQNRWASHFRTLVDGLHDSFQVVMTFRVGPGQPTEDDDSFPSGVEARRAADLEFARRIQLRSDAQQRRVDLVLAEADAGEVAARLREIGVAVSEEPIEGEPFRGRESPSFCVDDAGWHRTWYVERFPGHELMPGWLGRLVPSHLNVTISWHAHPLSSAWMIQYLQRQLTNIRADRLLVNHDGHADPVLEGALPSAVELQRRLTAYQDRAYQVALYLTLTSSSRPSLEQESRRIEAAGRAALCQLRTCTFRMLEARLATLPRGCDPLQRSRIFDSTSLTTLFPWLDPDLLHADGIVLGRSRATGAPISIDPFDTRRFENANIGVFGHSGAGKTYLLSTLLMGAAGTGTQVFVFDPEREYGRLAQELGGIEVNLALGSGHAINVLPPRPSGPLEDSWLGPAVADAADLVCILCGGIDESARGELEQAIRDLYETCSDPVLDQVAAGLAKHSRTRHVLQRWISGSLGRIFSAPSNVDLDAPIVSFALRELRDELVAPVHFLIARALWERIKARDRRRLLIVDELGLLFDDPTMRRFVIALARRIRKYDGGLVFATQNPGDLLGSEAGSVVATNPAIHFFGAQRPGEAAKLQRAFNLSDTQRRVLETARRGDFILSAGAERAHVLVQAPPWQERLMDAAREARTSRIIRGS